MNQAAGQDPDQALKMLWQTVGRSGPGGGEKFWNGLQQILRSDTDLRRRGGDLTEVELKQVLNALGKRLGICPASTYYSCPPPPTAGITG